MANRIASPRLAVPIPHPGKIIGIGLNYRDHAIESGMTIPSEPIVFGEVASCIIGPEEPIELPRASQEVDYEAELVVQSLHRLTPTNRGSTPFCEPLSI